MTNREEKPTVYGSGACPHCGASRLTADAFYPCNSCGLTVEGETRTEFEERMERTPDPLESLFSSDSTEKRGT